MKRTISFILILVMLLAAIPASAEKAAETELIFSAPVAVVGETLTLKAEAKNLPKCIGFSLVVQYDQQALELMEVEYNQANDLLTERIFTKDKFEEGLISLGENKIKLMVINMQSFEGKTCPLVTFKFNVLSVPDNKVVCFDIQEDTMLATEDSNQNPKEIDYTFTPIQCAVYNPHPFTDVKNQWFKEAVLFAHNRDLMNGVGDTTFAPNNTTTRAQLVTVLYRLEGLPQVVAASPFTDLTKNWYKDAVAWAFEQGIVNGKTATTFAPNAPITRQEIAAILYRYAQYKGIDTGTLGNLSVYPDADQLSSYAKAPMQWASAQGLITGVKKSATLTILSPKTSATRAQIATILMRFIQKNSEA